MATFVAFQCILTRIFSPYPRKVTMICHLCHLIPLVTGHRGSIRIVQPVTSPPGAGGGGLAVGRPMCHGRSDPRPKSESGHRRQARLKKRSSRKGFRSPCSLFTPRLSRLSVAFLCRSRCKDEVNPRNSIRPSAWKESLDVPPLPVPANSENNHLAPSK